jgi:MarR family transcriptional regulator for hemolysin
MESLQNRFALALQHTSRAWRVELERRLKSRRLSQAGWLTVSAVATAKRPPSQSELAEILGVKGATMVPMIDRLVVAGLVKQKCAVEDRRVKLVLITAAGQELYKQVNVEVEMMRQPLLATISKDELLIATEILELVQCLLASQP